MPGRISVEYYDITQNDPKTNQLGADHMLLSYQDDDGQEYIIRGGQADESALGTIGGQFSGYGPILTEAGVPAEESRDYLNRINFDTAETAHQLTDDELGGMDPADAWAMMTDQAQAIGAQQIPYDLMTQNSNSTIASVLNSVGVDVNQVLPFGRVPDNFPGIDNTLPMVNPLADPSGQFSSPDYSIDAPNNFPSAGDLFNQPVADLPSLADFSDL